MGPVLMWLSVGLVGVFYFALDKDASRKRAAFPVFVILFNGLFIGSSISQARRQPA